MGPSTATTFGLTTRSNTLDPSAHLGAVARFDKYGRLKADRSAFLALTNGSDLPSSENLPSSKCEKGKESDGYDDVGHDSI